MKKNRFAEYLEDLEQKYTTNYTAFQLTFRISLKKFWNKLHGFDVIAFDEWLKAGERSISDVVTEKYGEKAVTLIQNLIVTPQGHS
jgi:hypothetical protein